jgi:hypothetical protein
MAENDLNEAQKRKDIFSLESQMSGQATNSTGLVSEEKLVEEAASITELVLVQKMLLALIKFET